MPLKFNADELSPFGKAVVAALGVCITLGVVALIFFVVLPAFPLNTIRAGHWLS